MLWHPPVNTGQRSREQGSYRLSDTLRALNFKGLALQWEHRPRSQPLGGCEFLVRVLVSIKLAANSGADEVPE